MTTTTAVPARPARPRRRRSRARVQGPVLTAAGVVGLTAQIARRRDELDAVRELLADPRRDERLILDVERLLSEIDDYEALLAQADRMDEDAVAASPVVVLGSRVTLRFGDGTVETVRVVHPQEAFLDDERISAESPLAQALMGLATGDEGDVRAPSGSLHIVVEQVGDGKSTRRRRRAV